MFSGSITLVFPIFFTVSLEAIAETQLSHTLPRPKEFQQALKIRESTNINPFWLEQFLRPFTGKQCWVILRNFLNLDFFQTTIPLLTQYFEPVLQSGELCKYECAIWIASKFHGKRNLNETRAVLTNKACVSRYLLHSFSERKLNSSCVTLNLAKWIVSGKPGNCKITIDYALPKLFQENETYGHPYPYSENSLYHWTPLTLQIQVLIQVVTEPTNLSSYESRVLVREWSMWSSRLHPYGASHSTISVHFLVMIQYGTCSFIDKDAVTYTVYKLTPFEFKPSLIGGQDWKQMEGKDLKSVEKNGIGKETNRWSYSLSNELLQKSLSYCAIYAGIETRQGFYTVEDRIAKHSDADVHVLQIILGNFSYDIGNGSLCKYPGVIVKGSYHTGSEISDTNSYNEVPTIVFNSSLQDTRFVACGQRGRSKFAYNQLLSVFDTYTWGCWSISCLSVAVLITQMQNTESWKKYENSATQIVKMFLEQGTPFSGDWISHTRSRLILFGLMLGGVVLSSAYKSTNLYTMTQPRKPFTYETVDHLDSDNVTMFARLGNVEYFTVTAKSQYVTRGNWQSPFLTSSISNPQHHYYDDEMETPKSMVGYKMESTIYKTGMYTTDENPSNAIRLRPPPGAPKTLLKLFDAFLEQNLLNINEVSFNYTNWEEGKLLKELRSCSRVAVFLPEVFAVKYAKVLRQFENHKQVSVSKQAFRKDLTQIKFTGLITRAMLDRVARLKQSGIQLKWKNLFEFDLNTESSLLREEVSAVRLNGNVLIHFALLVVGILVALAALVLETSLASIRNLL